jgi:hypothetical protein
MVFSFGQIELCEMTVEAENVLHAAKCAVQVEVGLKARAILFSIPLSIPPPQPASTRLASERPEWRAELDHDPCQDSGSVSAI